MPLRTSHAHLARLGAFFLVFPLAARADGVPVGPVPTEAQSAPTVSSDGRGGATVSYKTASLRVGAVHVSAAGSPDAGFGFGPTVLPVTLEASEPLRATASSDSQLRVVSDHAAAASPVLTCVRTGGVAVSGFPVVLPLPLRHPAIVRGLGGRTLLVAKDADSINFWTLRAAIVSASGQVEFSVQVSSPLQFFDADAIDACSDGAGGLIAASPFYDATASGSKDLAVWKMAADGSRPWGDAPRPIVFAANDQTDVHVIPDGAGGVIMVWTDPRSALRSTDIFALRLDADGFRAPGWAFYGSPVCDALGAQSHSRITADGTGGVWIVWLDQRAGLDGDLRYSHVLGSGTLAPGFTSNGTSLCAASGAQLDAVVAGDGAGGCFAVWRDDRAGASDIYAQHILASGQVAAGWPTDGRALTTAAGVQDQPAIASVSGGKAVVAWRDARAGTTRIYATGIVDAATTAVPPSLASGLRLAALPAAGASPRVTVSLPAAGPAVLELLDVSGRIRARSELVGPLTDQGLTLAPASPLESGFYFARLRQGPAERSVRVPWLR